MDALAKMIAPWRGQSAWVGLQEPPAGPRWQTRTWPAFKLRVLIVSPLLHSLHLGGPKTELIGETEPAINV